MDEFGEKLEGRRNKIQYKDEYYYSGINLVEFQGHSKCIVTIIIVKKKKVKIE